MIKSAGDLLQMSAIGAVGVFKFVCAAAGHTLFYEDRGAKCIWWQTLIKNEAKS